MNIEQARAFVSRLSRAGEIPSGLSIALSTLFDRAEESDMKLKALQAEVNRLKAATCRPPITVEINPIDRIPAAIAFSNNEWALGAKVPMNINQGDTK